MQGCEGTLGFSNVHLWVTQYCICHILGQDVYILWGQCVNAFNGAFNDASIDAVQVGGFSARPTATLYTHRYTHGYILHSCLHSLMATLYTHGYTHGYILHPCLHVGPEIVLHYIKIMTCDTRAPSTDTIKMWLHVVLAMVSCIWRSGDQLYTPQVVTISSCTICTTLDVP